MNEGLKIAYEYLRSAERTTKELKDRLAKAGIAEQETEAVVAEMVRRKFVSDERVAEREVELAKGSRPIGRDKLQARLEARGVDEAETDYSLAEEAENAVGLLALRQPTDPARAARMLLSRGFSEEAVRSALSRHFPDWEG